MKKFSEMENEIKSDNFVKKSRWSNLIVETF